MPWHNCVGSRQAPDGRTYVGEWRSGKSHGQGTLTYPDGNRYEGAFKESRFHGQGTLSMPGGNRYVGEFRDGNFEGQGTYTAADGGKFTGEWRNNERFQGTVVDRNGRVVLRVQDGVASQTREDASRQQQSRVEAELAEIDRTIAAFQWPPGKPPQTLPALRERWCLARERLDRSRQVPYGNWPSDRNQRFRQVLSELNVETDALGAALRETGQRLLRPDAWAQAAGQHAFDFVVLVDTLDPGHRKLLDDRMRLGDGRLPVRFQIFDLDIPDFQALGLQASVSDLVGGFLMARGARPDEGPVIGTALQQLLAARRVEIASVDFATPWSNFGGPGRRRASTTDALAAAISRVDARQVCSGAPAAASGRMNSPEPAPGSVPLIAVPRLALEAGEAYAPAWLKGPRFQQLGVLSWASMVGVAQARNDAEAGRRNATERQDLERRQAAAKVEADFMARLDRALQSGKDVAGAIAIRRAGAAAPSAVTACVSRDGPAVVQLVRSPALRSWMGTAAAPLMIPLGDPKKVYDGALDGQCAVVVDLAANLKRYLQTVATDSRFRVEFGPMSDTER